MSKDSEIYELRVATLLNRIPGVSAKKMGGVEYSDVFIRYKGAQSWLEVKMNHSDNLINTRMSYEKGKWTAVNEGAGTKEVLGIISSSFEAKQFLIEMGKLNKPGVAEVTLSTTKGAANKDGVISFDDMKDYFAKKPNKYIATINNVDAASIVSKHYTNGKKEPAYYIQIGDDFYRTSEANPFELGTSDKEVPIFNAKGTLKVRVSYERNSYYVIVPELKAKIAQPSEYSTMPATKKINPFTPITKKKP